MQPEENAANPKRVKGWIFDLYPSAFGQMSIWIITENGQRIRLIDEFKPKVYISGKEEDLYRLLTQFFADRSIASCSFVYKYASPTNIEKSKVLEVILKDCRRIPFFVRKVLETGRYLRYQLSNCDLRSAQAYLYDRDIFPLAFTDIEVEKHQLKYHVLDSVESVDYQIPPLRIMRIHIEIAKKGKIANFDDPLKEIIVSQSDKRTVIDVTDEKEKLLRFLEVMRELDPDILLTRGGDSHVFPYLTKRALVNGVLDRFVLSRERNPLVAKRRRGTTFFSYGRIYYRAPTRRLYGRVHIDENNTFILIECGIDGLIEIARTCRVPLHRASRSSIGSSMSSLQFYQAIKDNVLIPRNKRIPETFKSAYELLVGDRGGFVYEPRIGIHDWVGEVDFSSMYPALMVKNNISAETVLCKCCPDSALHIPELNYHICEKRVGIVPKVLRFAIAKRLRYKRLKEESRDQRLKEVYERRQGALKWILVTCFGYLGYKNAKFGTVDGHIGVCAFGRQAFLKAARIAERRGFSVIHGIVDSLWLKKKDATEKEYVSLCRVISEEVGVPLNFEGRYRWIIFLPSRMHPNVGVLNRYYGVKEDGRIKVRGLEVRRRDTPRFVHDAQMEMIRVLANATDSKAFIEKIPDALKVVKEYRRKLLDGEVPIWDLIITKRLSKNLNDYKQRVSQAIAAEQLLKEGVQVSAGKNVRFIFTSAESKCYERRVKAKELVEEHTNSDVKKYLLLLYTATSNILSPFGYSAKEIHDSVRGYQCTKLTSFQPEEDSLENKRLLLKSPAVSSGFHS
ncbi:MAG: DNA polymerase domain-containing protein [Candidatus Bathyarchaeota archaeon]|jgi:DNA polymerase elongation subunit (family B)